MKPTRPYLIRAFYEWIIESECTPYIVVNAEMENVLVPTEYIENGQIVLNISMNATQELNISNDAIEFKARFHGNSHNVYVPVHSVLAIYASENGKGMVFNDEDISPEEEPPPDGTSSSESGSNKTTKKNGKSHLTVVK